MSGFDAAPWDAEPVDIAMADGRQLDADTVAELVDEATVAKGDSPEVRACAIRHCDQPGKEIWLLTHQGSAAVVTFCCIHHVAASIVAGEDDGRWEGCQHIGGLEPGT